MDDIYQTDKNGIINEPGKFEAEPLFVPYYWDLAMQGFADKDDGQMFTFIINEDDMNGEFASWFEHGDVLRLWEDGNGFVYHSIN